jgi:predicted helicase
MYLRFYRWAMDRLDNKNGGIVAFVSNRSFVDAINTDGFRAVIGREFDYLYILDTRSDVRKNPKISGAKNNVFGIQTGVAIMFAVKRPHDPQTNTVIHYYTMQDEDTREEKLQFLKHNALNTIPYSAYKNEIITLIKKIITVSLKTLEIIQQMEAEDI